ncbi:O-methyltransferase [Adhaeribacter aerolatus]|uniref:O-methyltransferase n=1 Tax=Adhaeribacter aerolatus TaxID=670289 RepID=A0A512B4K4_9BACT|nr:class I SAM-dependent methyltransferase [Adhaeribacter aerolatus]GEO06889.1 O-methyltransferase [Adhaeribacter aerolatus]
MSLLRLGFKFFVYRLQSFRLHGVHSPFVFDLYQHVIQHDGYYGAYKPIEKLRKELKQNHNKIEITDLGAGSKINPTYLRPISELAKISAKPPKYAQLLFRLVNYFQPNQVLELGTSLGLTTAYLASARPKGTVYTFEGCPKIAQQAQVNFRKLKLSNINLITGNIDQTLPAFLQDTGKVDFVYFDGNHRYEPTLRYFQLCLEKHTENTVFVFDDIYWSAEMEKAWKEICSHPAVTLSIDLFQLGLIFFRKAQPKQHFTLWY